MYKTCTPESHPQLGRVLGIIATVTEDEPVYQFSDPDRAETILAQFTEEELSRIVGELPTPGCGDPDWSWLLDELSFPLGQPS